MTDRIRPFSNGTQYADWSEFNCQECARSNYPGELLAQPCELEVALLNACFDDGKVSLDVAERTGTLDHRPPRQNAFSYCWRCKEFIPKSPDGDDHVGASEPVE